MAEMILKKQDMAAFTAEINKGYEFFGPVKNGKQLEIARINDVSDMVLEGYRNTNMSPKNYFFPQSEELMAFKKYGDDANIYKDSLKEIAQRVIFGIRPCDAKAFSVLDKIFKNDQFIDNYWFSKREKSVMIGLGCNMPCSTCFCTSVNSHPFGEAGLDVLATDLDDRYLLKTLTKKGEDILSGVSCLEAANDDDLSSAKSLSEKAASEISGNLELKNIDQKAVLDLFNADFWERVQEPCLNCGTCTYVCPTCHCFDIQDEVFKDEGIRVRNWDSCMSWLFTMHGSGHNPRPGKKERVRQRFMHKFKYIPIKRDGEIGCVGCGRCIQMCPVNIDVREVVKLMNS